eukprot:TRINITY_DN3473_c0_g1_i2.p1 TRINITY_DN3473_c0_g1~~TRINITY_DN3473_c0_g1_i2.p1  ORF type:complete len:187 (-),score=66.01 TRINITY_DN3473_c0_g1_i2:153-713(-)
MKVFVLLCLVSGHFALPFIPPNIFSNSWWDDWSSWSDLIPSFMQPASGIKLDVTDLTNQSARVNCSWTGTGSVNLTWSLDGDVVPADLVEEGEGAASSVLQLQWEALGKNAGDVVLVSCTGESAGRTNDTGAWVSAAEMMETITVPGDDTGLGTSGGVKDEADDNNDASKEEDNESSEESDKEEQP